MEALRLAGVLMMAVVPVGGDVVRSFDPPACERCAGHRGVTISSTPGDVVRAPVSGVVTFAGSVGGRLYVVVDVGNSVLVTLGAVARISSHVIDGVRVESGEALAWASETTYLSVRVGQVHREPLRALGLGRVRLVGFDDLQSADVGQNGTSR